MGYGIISVDQKWAHQGDLLDGYAKIEDVPPEVLHKRLLLPDEYTVGRTGIDYMRRVYLIAVMADAIPDVPEGHEGPQVTATYSRADDGTVSLLGIDVEPRVDSSPWHVSDPSGEASRKRVTTWVRDVAKLGSLADVFRNLKGYALDWPDDNVKCAEEIRAALDAYFDARIRKP